ncbi:hypothetical protein AMJ86_09370 [bacterium SM23_57]|nr:MAG: hypothetical protein AMJ86_09370 [bacterium SM23_57]
MKVCLISPYSDFTSNAVRLLSATLRQKGHEVTSIFLVDMSFEGGYLIDFSGGYPVELLGEILEKTQDADIIGLSLLTQYYSRSIQLTQYLRKYLSVPIIWGGVHPTVRPDDCLQYADYVCVGEGEHAFPEFLDALENGDDPLSVRNIWGKRDGEVVRNASRPLLRDLDSLPYPDYGPDGHWVVSMDGRRLLPVTENLNRDYLYLGPVHEKLFTYQILTSRGCPHRCSFCGNLAMHTAAGERIGYRPRSIEHVIGELEHIHNRYGNATPVLIKEEKVRLLVDAGLRWLEIGIQSGSPRTLELFNRQWSTPARVLKSAEILKPYQKTCLIIYDLILDNPWEPLEDMLDTLKLILKLPRPYHLQSFQLIFYPGTELYDRALQDGIIKTDDTKHFRENMQQKKACYINFLFSLAGVRFVPRWVIKIMSWPLPVKIGNRPFFNRIFEGIYSVGRWLKTIFFRHPTPKNLVVDVDVP